MKTDADYHLGNFSLPAFCRDAAALAKYLIRAREQFEPGFLGDPAAYASWNLSNLEAEPFEPDKLLGLAIATADKIQQHMLDMGGSGGVPEGDPLLEFKLSVSSLGDGWRLSQGLTEFRNSGGLDWSTVTEWDQLPEIRAGLDAHYQVNGQGANRNTPQTLVAESQRVKLFQQNDKPIAIVDDQEIQKLNPKGYAVVRVLLEAGERRLSTTELIRKSRSTDAVNILKRLASRAPWSMVIELPGAPYGGYGIS